MTWTLPALVYQYAYTNQYWSCIFYCLCSSYELCSTHSSD